VHSHKETCTSPGAHVRSLKFRFLPVYSIHVCDCVQIVFHVSSYQVVTSVLNGICWAGRFGRRERIGRIPQRFEGYACVRLPYALANRVY